MAIGAGWAGARAITATSGPGVSLMTEFVGMAYFAEIPVVVVDVQRMGPSTGLPTRTSQGDLMKLHLLGHGDCRHLVLIPGSVEECFSLTIDALDLAQQFQTPVFVASELDLGMNLWLSDPFPYPTRPIQRGKVVSAEDLERLGQFERYRDVDGDGVCYRTIPGTEHPLAAYFTRGTGHNEKSGYSERPDDWKKNLDRLALKLETARRALPAPVIEGDASARVGILAYGGTHFAVVEARDQLREQGVPTEYARIRALPFSDDVTRFIERHQRIYVVEQNRDAQITPSFGRSSPARWPIDFPRSAITTVFPSRPRISFDPSSAGRSIPPAPAGPPAISSETTRPLHTPTTCLPSERSAAMTPNSSFNSRISDPMPAQADNPQSGGRRSARPARAVTDPPELNPRSGVRPVRRLDHNRENPILYLRQARGDPDGL
jgi:pyruvate/2-oxoacid:ferredoxin oxidoreductase alpha subunit